MVGSLASTGSPPDDDRGDSVAIRSTNSIGRVGIVGWPSGTTVVSADVEAPQSRPVNDPTRNWSSKALRKGVASSDHRVAFVVASGLRRGAAFVIEPTTSELWICS